MGHPYPENQSRSRGNLNLDVGKTNRDKHMNMEESPSRSVLITPCSLPPTIHHPLKTSQILSIEPAKLLYGLALQPVNPVRDPEVRASTTDKPNSASSSQLSPTSVMPRNGNNTLSLNFDHHEATTTHVKKRSRHEMATAKPALEWDWDVEHEDRRREKKADASLRGAAPFEVDRKVLKDIVREKMGLEVGRIKFLSAGMS